MKKFLSLVLALVMAMSLVTISAGAKDFTDDADVNYDAAVEVMSELKVIDGYTDGSFRPATQLNRGAAAKIICNMILGPTTASALSASSAPFSDVPADSVFAGYITYCSKEGIINGYADGTFRPTAPLTGYAFMKMLLGALGYDADIEGYTGANWSINVAKQALGIDLDAGIDSFVGTQYIDRETACQLALNTLKADMVEYDSKTSVTVNGAEVVVGGSEAKKIAVDKDVKETFDDDMVLQFAEEYFPNLKTAPKADDFGRPGAEWKIKNKVVGVFADDADASYTAKVKGKEIYADLGASSKTAVAYEDGLEVKLDDEFAIAKKNGEKIGNQGTLTEVFFDADANDGDGAAIIVMVNTYIMQVDGDYDEDEECIDLVEVEGSDCALSSATVYTDDFALVAELEDEDYVLVTVAANEDEEQYVASIEKVEPTTAVVDEHVLNESLTADGTEYKFAYAWETTAKTFNYVVDEEYELYFDTYGNIIFSEGVEAEKQYVYVDEFAETSFMDKNSKVDAYAYFLDGSEDEVRVTKVNGKKVKAGNIETAIVDDGEVIVPALEELEGQWFTYTEKDGAYELKTLRLEAEGDDAVELLIGATEGEIISDETVMIAVGETVARGNKETQFVIVEADGDVSIYTGIKKAPEVTGDDATYVAIVVDENNYADYVFIALGADALVDGTADSSDLIFVMKGEKWGTDAADNDYYRYKAIVNGEEGKIRAEDTTDLADHFTLYTEVEYDSETGYVSKWTSVDEAADEDDEFVIVDDATELVQKGNVIAAKSETQDYKFYMADEAVIYVIDMSDEDVETVSAKALCKAFEGGKIYGVMDKNEDIVALYVVVA